MNSTFDPTSLLDTTYEDDLNTRLTPFPETECFARIKNLEVRKVTTKEGADAHVMDVTFVSDDEHVRKETGLQEPQVRMSIWLDVDANTGRLQTKSQNPNANVRVGRLKEACGVKPGKKWGLPDLIGLGCWIRTKQRKVDDDTYCDVVGVQKEPSRRAA